MFWFDFGFGFLFFNLCCELLCCSLCFFTSVLRRTVTLLTQLAKGMASHAALETQVNNATEAAKKYMAENERLQEVSLNFFRYIRIQQVASTKYSGDGLLLHNVCLFFLLVIKGRVMFSQYVIQNTGSKFQQHFINKGNRSSPYKRSSVFQLQISSK